VATEALRVLAPGGLMILETPNPENLVVGSSAFYMDPTHHKPLPPLLLGFLAEFAGFGRVATLRLHEGVSPDRPATLIDVLAGVSPDYAIVAQKPGASSPALDALLATKHGVNLNELAERWERQLQDRLREMQVSSGMGREAIAGLSFRIEALERARGAQGGVERGAAQKVFELQDQLRAMQASTSWRVTAPMRWVGGAVLTVRQKGVVGIAKSTARSIVMASLRFAHRVLAGAPRLRRSIARAGLALGMDSVVYRFAPKPPPPLDITTLSEDARHVFQELHHKHYAAHAGKDR
jgi:O-antigen chain-terminating methyltransferase